jgi:hypothetical protein
MLKYEGSPFESLECSSKTVAVHCLESRKVNAITAEEASVTVVVNIVILTTFYNYDFTNLAPMPAHGQPKVTGLEELILFESVYAISEITTTICMACCNQKL